jgi:ATP-dependent Clp protease ATP-binding subunit ClpX
VGNLRNDILAEDTATTLEQQSNAHRLITPKRSNRKDAYIIGQERAKRVPAVAVYNHYKKLFGNLTTNSDEPKRAISRGRASGFWKTLLAQTLAASSRSPLH